MYEVNILQSFNVMESI